MPTVDFFNVHIVVNITLQVLYDYVTRMAKHFLLQQYSDDRSNVD